MWKWLGGCLLVVIVLFVASAMWGIRTMKKSLAPDGSAVVTIAATPARIFASLNHGDSAATWMADGSQVLTSRHGPLVPGDSVRVELPTRMRIAKQRAMILRVKEVVTSQLMVFEILAPDGGTMAIRRDSIAARGDSTRVTTVIQRLPDSVAARQSAGKAKSDSGVGGLALEMMLSLMSMQAKLELTKLKTRVEASPRAIR